MSIEEKLLWHSRYNEIVQGRMKLHDIDLEGLRKHFNDGGTLRDYPEMSYNQIQRLAEDDPEFAHKLNELLRGRAESYMDMAHTAYVRMCENPEANLKRLNDIIENGIKMAKRYNPDKFGDKVGVKQDTNLTVKDNLTHEVTEFLASQGVAIGAGE